MLGSIRARRLILIMAFITVFITETLRKNQSMAKINFWINFLFMSFCGILGKSMDVWDKIFDRSISEPGLRRTTSCPERPGVRGCFTGPKRFFDYSKRTNSDHICTFAKCENAGSAMPNANTGLCPFLSKVSFQKYEKYMISDGLRLCTDKNFKCLFQVKIQNCHSIK